MVWVGFREGSRQRKIKEEEEEHGGWGRTKRTEKRREEGISWEK